MAKRGPTRESLQADIQTVPVLNGKRLQMYFNGSRQLLLQGEAYFDEGELIMVSFVFGCGLLVCHRASDFASKSIQCFGRLPGSAVNFKVKLVNILTR